MSVVWAQKRRKSAQHLIHQHTVLPYVKHANEGTKTICMCWRRGGQCTISLRDDRDTDPLMLQGGRASLR